MFEKEILELCSKNIKDTDKLIELQKLVARKGNVNAESKEGSPLHRVSARGDLECVKFLLKSGAHLEEKGDGDGLDALSRALECCEYETAQYLAIVILNKHGIPIQHNEPEEVIQYKLLTMYLYSEQHEPFSDKQKMIAHCLSPFIKTATTHNELLTKILGETSTTRSYYSSAQVFNMTETKAEAKALEDGADDSSDEEEDADWEKNSNLKKSCEEFKKSPNTPEYIPETDPEGYSYLAHRTALKKLHSKEVNQQYRLLKRQTLPSTKCLATDDAIVAWVKNSIIELLKNTFSIPKTQALAATEIWNAFSNHDQWLTQVSIDLATQHKRVLFKQMNSDVLLREVVYFVLTVQNTIKTHIQSCEEKLQLQDPPCFAIADFVQVTDDLIRKWLLSKNLIKRNGKFLGKNDRVPLHLDAKDEVGKKIYAEFKTTDGNATFNTFTSRTRAQDIFNLLCEKEIHKGAGSLIILTARGYAFKPTTTKTQLEQSDFKDLFDPARFEELTKKYLPYTVQRLRDELCENATLQVTPFKFVEVLKKQRKTMGILLERGLPPQQYTFESKSCDDYYAKLRLVMRFETRRIRDGADKNTQEEIFQAAWRFGNSYAALEEQSISSNGNRSDLVINLSSYAEINDMLKKYPNYHKQIANWINEFLFFDNARLDAEITKANVAKPDIAPLKKLIINLTYLLLGCEVQRNPAALVTNRMALQLIQAGKLKWEEALAKPEFKDFCAGGEMPMSMGKYKAARQKGDGGDTTVGSEPVKCARVLQKHFGLFAPKPWKYEGDLANENTGNRERQHIIELIRRENAIVKKWLTFKKLDKADFKKQIEAIDKLLSSASLEEKAEILPLQKRAHA